MSLDSRRNALAISIGWWLLRRKLRKRADAAITGLLAGTGTSGAATPKRRHRLRAVVLAAMFAGGAFLAWTRFRGGGTTMGHVDAGPAVATAGASVERAPAPEPDPVAA